MHVEKSVFSRVLVILIDIIFVRNPMNIQSIRDKYQQILQNEDSDQSVEEIDRSKVRKNAISKSHVLTEHSQNLSFSNVNIGQQGSKIVIALKERVAQSLRNFNMKEEQNAILKKQIIKLQQKIKLIEVELSDTKKTIQRDQNRLIQQKVNSVSLQKEVEKLQQIITQAQVDKDLILKQVQYYKNKIMNLKKQRKGTFKLIQSVDKQMKSVERVKQQNVRLREDVKRMRVMLNQYSQNGVSSKIEDKHFLGKPYRQFHLWFPQNLVGEVEIFLKKEQVGYGNKQFLNNLVKFIDRYVKICKKTDKNKIKSDHCQYKAKQKNSQYRSSSLYDMGDSNIKTTHLSNSVLKKSILISNIVKNGEHRFARSFALPQKDESPSVLCSHILTQYQKALGQVLNSKQSKRKVILKLTKQMISNIMHLLYFDRSIMN